MDWIVKILGLVVIALIGFSLVPVTANLLTMLNVIDVESVEANFGQTMIERSVIVWIGSMIMAIGALFIQQKWRYILLTMPIYAPSLFSFIYALSHK